MGIAGGSEVRDRGTDAMRCMITAISMLAVLAAAAGTVAAAPGEADRLFEEGRGLAEKGEYEAACAKFARAFDLDPAPGIELNLADCHEHLGHLTRAFRMFQKVARHWDQNGDPVRAKFARDRATAVARRLATVVIGVPDPGIDGLTIRIDDHPVKPAAEIREVIDPGQVQIVARATGKAPFIRSRQVAAGETVVIEIAFTDAPPAAARATPPAAPDDAEAPRRTRIRIAIGLSVAGAASLLGALGTSLYGSSKYNDTVRDKKHCFPGEPPRCDDIGSQRIRDAQRFTTAGTGLAIAGGALVIASGIVYLTAPKGVTVAPVSTAALTGVVLSARF